VSCVPIDATARRRAAWQPRSGPSRTVHSGVGESIGVFVGFTAHVFE
jgi:hypothetical protein